MGRLRREEHRCRRQACTKDKGNGNTREAPEFGEVVLLLLNTAEDLDILFTGHTGHTGSRNLARHTLRQLKVDQ